MPVSTSKLSQLTSSGVLTKENIAAKQQEYNTRNPTSAAAAPTQPASPANASAAPSKGSGNLFTALTDALNQYQQQRVKEKHYEIADEYVIAFADKAISNAQVVKPGPVTYKNTAPKAVDTTAAKLDNNTDSVNVNSQTWQVLAGTQIVQLIDQIMRSSRYITDQQLGNYNEDGKWVPSKTANPKAQIAWYKISVSAKQLGYDKKRRDNAYRMTFTISPYRINQMDSQYFPPGNYLGPHKVYDYWFTGLNTQVLSYEQEYNNAYYTTLTGSAEDLAVQAPTGRDQRKRTYMATSENKGQGQANYVNEAADNAASFLYSVADLSEVIMKIVGDPAWLQQGEVSTGVNAQTFNYKPFNPDGTINYDSQQVTFTVSFNRPTDYDFNTGVMNLNSKSGDSKETFAFLATTCKSVFSKGVFTQELGGTLLPMASNPSPSTTARPAPAATTTAAGSRTTTNSNAGNGYQDEAAQNADGNGSAASSGYQNEAQQNADNGPPTPQPASPPAPPTSDGDVAPSNTQAPQNAGTTDKVVANEEETAAVNAYVAAGGTFPRGTGPITSGPLYDNVLAAKASLTARQQSSATPVTTSAGPQVIAKDDS